MVCFIRKNAKDNSFRRNATKGIRYPGVGPDYFFRCGMIGRPMQPILGGHIAARWASLGTAAGCTGWNEMEFLAR